MYGPPEASARIDGAKTSFGSVAKLEEVVAVDPSESVMDLLKESNVIDVYDKDVLHRVVNEFASSRPNTYARSKNNVSKMDRRDSFRGCDAPKRSSAIGTMKFEHFTLHFTPNFSNSYQVRRNPGLQRQLGSRFVKRVSILDLEPN